MTGSHDGLPDLKAEGLFPWIGLLDSQLDDVIRCRQATLLAIKLQGDGILNPDGIDPVNNALAVYAPRRDGGGQVHALIAHHLQHVRACQRFVIIGVSLDVYKRQRFP